jgi:hypothetical protein
MFSIKRQNHIESKKNFRTIIAHEKTQISLQKLENKLNLTHNCKTNHINEHNSVVRSVKIYLK